MYSPYDSYIEETQEDYKLDRGWSGKEDYFTPGKIMALPYLAGGGLAVAGLGMFSVNRAHANAMKNNGGYAKWANKMRGADWYGDMVSPKGIAKFYLPRTRNINAMDRQFYSTVFPKRKEITSLYKGIGKGKVLTLPIFAAGSSLMTMNEEFNNNFHPSSLPIGAAKEALGIGGLMAGQAAGAAIGSMIAPGPGTIAGALVGGAVGALTGYNILDTVKWMKSKGRQWTLPDVGGNFRDSRTAMTMRQRSLNAISTSQFNVRSSLGNEASHLYFGY